MIYDNLSGNILKHPEYVKCKENSPNILYGSDKNEKTAAINMYLKELNPKFYELLQTASNCFLKPPPERPPFFACRFWALHA